MPQNKTEVATPRKKPSAVIWLLFVEFGMAK